MAMGAEENEGAAPKIVAVQPEYTFDPVPEGTKVTHDFIIKNEGTATLEITNVKPGWGCTQVSRTKPIPPGQQDKIAIEVNTNHYGGKTFKRSIAVFSNDPKNDKIILTISGPVEKIVSVEPDKVKMFGFFEDNLTETVKITPVEKYPFKITGAKTDKDKYISFDLKPTEDAGKTAYMLTITNKYKEAGRYSDTIMLQTDNKTIPEIKVKVLGSIRDRAEEEKKAQTH